MEGILIAHTALCAGLLWMSFCRAVRTCHRTRTLVRLAIVAQATVAVCAGAAPWLWDYVPGWPALAVLGVYVLMQGIAAPRWRDGVPMDYQAAHAAGR